MQESAVLAIASGNYVSFTDTLETTIHNTVHVRTGGTMLQLHSPEAPEFFLHHNHIDKLWDDWQKKSAAHLNAYSFNLAAPMPVAYGNTPGHFNDLKKTKVMYIRSSPSVLGAGHFILLSCSLFKVGLLNFDATVVLAALAKASPSQLLEIPQLPAPVLTAAEEERLIKMMQEGGSERDVIAFRSRVKAGRDTLERANMALKAAGTLRESFDTPSSRALGFDLAKAVEVLKIPSASQTPAGTAGGIATGGIVARPTSCQRPRVFCAPLRRCVFPTEKCSA
jgi:hypothetical protein